MSNVIDFASRRKDPHIAGDATCLDCKHEWVAVAPAGTTSLQCPRCETMRGVWNTAISLDPQYRVHTCDCGSQHMLVMLERWQMMCVACGTVGVLSPGPEAA